MPPTRRPESLAPPPANLASRQLPLYTLSPVAEKPWVRLFRCEYTTSLFFGKTGNGRFDDPEREYGVLYAGRDIQCAFIETFGDSRNADNELEIDERDLDTVCAAELTFVRPLRLVDLTGPGLQVVGADAQLTAGDNYPETQAWSRGFWSHPMQPDGLYYRARHDPSRLSMVLFDRASDSVKETLHGPLAAERNRRFRIAILSTYRVSLL